MISLRSAPTKSSVDEGVDNAGRKLKTSLTFIWMQWFDRLSVALSSLFGDNGGTNLEAPYGHLLSTASQTAAAATITSVLLNTTTYSNGISIGTPASHIVFSKAGMYSIQIGFQLSNTAAADDDFTVWVRKNGVDVPNSAYIQSVPSSHGATNGHTALSFSDQFSLAADDYLEFYWTTDSGTSSIVAYNSGVVPTHPNSPSVIVTSQFISAT